MAFEARQSLPRKPGSPPVQPEVPESFKSLAALRDNCQKDGRYKEASIAQQKLESLKEHEEAQQVQVWGGCRLEPAEGKREECLRIHDNRYGAQRGAS